MRRLCSIIMLLAAIVAVAGNPVKPASGTMQTIYTVARIKHNDQGETTSKPYFKMFHLDRVRKVFSVESGTVNSGIYVIDWDIKSVKKEGDTERFEMTFPKSREKDVEMVVTIRPDGQGGRIIAVHRLSNPMAKEYLIGTKEQFMAAYQTIDGNEYVDLGLSVLWGTKNLGAKSVTDVGDYYTFGSITPAAPYPSTNPWNQHLQSNYAGNPAYDAVAHTYGGKSRMATKAEWKKLSEYTYRDVYKEGFTYLGVKYPPGTYRLMSKINGHSIFIVPGGAYAGEKQFPSDWAYFYNGSVKQGTTYMNGGIMNTVTEGDFARNLRPVYGDLPSAGAKSGNQQVDQAIDKTLKKAPSPVKKKVGKAVGNLLKKL